MPRVDSEVRSMVSAALGRARWRPLAVAQGDGVWVLGLPEVFVVVRGDAVQVVGWHEIRQASWDSESSTLTWRTGDGGDSVTLLAEGRVPELVQERVEASIVFRRKIPVFGGNVFLSGRRDLKDPSVLFLETIPGAGVVLEDPRVSTGLARVRAQIAAEYDISGHL